MVEANQAHRTAGFSGDAKLDPDRRYSSEIAAMYLGCTELPLVPWTVTQANRIFASKSIGLM
jgi:hypothetical protein